MKGIFATGKRSKTGLVLLCMDICLATTFQRQDVMNTAWLMEFTSDLEMDMRYHRHSYAPML